MIYLPVCQRRRARFVLSLREIICRRCVAEMTGGFVLAIPVVRGGDLFQVPVRLRYRVSGGNVLWRLVPHRADLVSRAVFDEAAEKVRAATELPLFYGRPEV